MELQLDKLYLSPKQGWTKSLDPLMGNWPEIFFWTEGLMLLNWSQGIPHMLKKVTPEVQDSFWQGSALPSLRNLDRDLFQRWPVARIIESCRVRDSKDLALDILITKARGEKLDSKGTISRGGVRLDEGKYCVRMAETLKAVNWRVLPFYIHEAAKRNDTRFFIRLGRALQSRKKIAEVDWARCNPLACFLMNNWCEGHDYNCRLPALCFFNDQALADFCCAAFGRKPGNPSPAGIRQWRRRLGLKQVRTPKVRRVHLKGQEILFA